MKIRRLLGLVGFVISSISLLYQGVKYFFPNYNKTDASVFFGMGTKLTEIAYEKLRLVPYGFFLHGNGNIKLSHLSIEDYCTRVNYIYSFFTKNESSENNDIFNLDANLFRDTKNFANDLEFIISQNRRCYDYQTYEIYNLREEYFKKIDIFSAYSMIITHMPSARDTINTMVDEAILSALFEFHPNDFKRFIISYLTSANTHSFTLVENQNESQVFHVEIKGCSITEIKHQQNQSTLKFLKFVEGLPNVNIFKEDLLVGFEFYHNDITAPAWYISIQEKYITKVQNYLVYNSIIEEDEELLQCLSKETNLNMQLINGLTPIMLATMYNQIKMVSILLKHGADCNIAKNNGITPLMAAAHFGYEELVSILIPFSKLNEQDEYGNTALSYAVKSDHNNISQALIDCGVDIGVKNIYGEDILEMVAFKNNRELISILMPKLTEEEILESLALNFLAQSSDMQMFLCEEWFKQGYFWSECYTSYVISSHYDKIYQFVMGVEKCFDI